MVDLTQPGWTAGGAFTTMLLQSIKDAKGSDGSVEVIGLTSSPSGTGTLHIPQTSPLPGEAPLRALARRHPRRRPIPRERELRARLRLPDAADPVWAAAHAKLDVLLPLTEAPHRRARPT